MNVKLESDRLILDKYHIEDIGHTRKILSEPLIWKYSSRIPTSDIEEAKKYVDNVLKNYDEGRCDFQALFLKETHEYIGEAGVISFNQRCLRATVGYNLLPAYWGHGYASEIMTILVKHLFDDLKVERIEALVSEENQASRKVLEKSGFLCEGLLRNFGYINNSHVNVCYYGMIKSDYISIK